MEIDKEDFKELNRLLGEIVKQLQDLVETIGSKK